MSLKILYYKQLCHLLLLDYNMQNFSIFPQMAAHLFHSHFVSNEFLVNDSRPEMKKKEDMQFIVGTISVGIVDLA